MPEPVSLAEARLHLREPDETENTLIESLIVAAREHAEKATGLILAKREIVHGVPGFGRWIEIAAWPIANDAAFAVSYLDSVGVRQDVAATSWRVSRARPVRLLPIRSGWDVPGSLAIDAVLPVEVKVEAGFEPGDVPAAIKAAMLLMVGHLFAQRDGVGEAEWPSAVAVLLRPYRLMRV